MPELPDVEIFRRYFNRTSLRKTITGVQLRAPEMLHGITPRQFSNQLLHRCFTDSNRHGKYLFAHLDDRGFLVLHFGMTGQLKYYKHPGEQPRHTRLLLEFENGYHLAFDCLRKLGRISYTRDFIQFVRQRNLGPDVLAEAFDYGEFQRILIRKKGSAKSLLMNQKTLAGIGNLYADEILFQSGIHPAALVERLSVPAKKRLYDAMKSVLVTAIESEVKAEKLPETYLRPPAGRTESVRYAQARFDK